MKRNACQKCVFAVDDDKPHCGLRGFTSSFNVEWCESENDTVPNGYELQEDGYFSWVEKKKEYPKTYEECCEILGCCSYNVGFDRCETSYEEILHNKILTLRKLLICRDAYWKIAGEEMGLGKPWENSRYEVVYGICRDEGNIVKQDDYWGDTHVFEFPIREMRDAFYENFKELIESVKELV